MTSVQVQVKSNVTFPQSQSVAQNLLSASMCEILWQRKVLPDDCFEAINFAKNTLHKIKADATLQNEKAKKLFEWIKDDVCSAIKQKILKKVVMSIHSSEKFEAANLLEAYSFNFAYDGDHCSFAVDSEPHDSSPRGSVDKENENARGEASKKSKKSKKLSDVDPVEGRPKEEIQRSTECTIRSLLSLLGQYAELPKDHFVSYAMYYNDSQEVARFRPSSDFSSCPDGLEDFNAAVCNLSICDPNVIKEIFTQLWHCTTTPTHSSDMDNNGTELPGIHTGHHQIVIRCKNSEDKPNNEKSSPYKSTLAKGHGKGNRNHPYAKPVYKEESSTNEDEQEIECSQDPNRNDKHSGMRCSIARAPICQK